MYHTNQKETKVDKMTKSEAKKLHCTVEAAIAVIAFFTRLGVPIPCDEE